MSQSAGNALGVAAQPRTDTTDNTIHSAQNEPSLAAAHAPLDFRAGSNSSDADVAFSLADFGLNEIITSQRQMVRMTNPELLPEVELFGKSFVDTISRDRVRFELEISDEEKASLTHAIENVTNLARSFEKNLALLADPIVLQNLTRDLVETMCQGGVYYHFPLRGSNGRALEAIFPPPLKEDNIEFRPRDKQGPIWIRAEATDGSGHQQLVPLRAIAERLSPPQSEFLNLGEDVNQLYAEAPIKYQV